MEIHNLNMTSHQSNAVVTIALEKRVLSVVVGKIQYPQGFRRLI